MLSFISVKTWHGLSCGNNIFLIAFCHRVSFSLGPWKLLIFHINISEKLILILGAHTADKTLMTPLVIIKFYIPHNFKSLFGFHSLPRCGDGDKKKAKWPLSHLYIHNINKPKRECAASK
jgi:hypothetical protein